MWQGHISEGVVKFSFIMGVYASWCSRLPFITFILYSPALKFFLPLGSLMWLSNVRFSTLGRVHNSLWVIAQEKPREKHSTWPAWLTRIYPPFSRASLVSLQFPPLVPIASPPSQRTRSYPGIAIITGLYSEVQQTRNSWLQEPMRKSQAKCYAGFS